MSFACLPHQLSGYTSQILRALSAWCHTSRITGKEFNNGAGSSPSDSGSDSRMRSGRNVRPLEVIKGSPETTGSGKRIISVDPTGPKVIMGLAFGANYKCLDTLTANIWCRSTKESTWRQVFNSCSQWEKRNPLPPPGVCFCFLKKQFLRLGKFSPWRCRIS